MKTIHTAVFPKVKICGLTNLEQALSCAELGVDWIGLNCWPGSSRYIAPEQAREIVRALPESLTTVGVFVNEPRESLEKIMIETRIDLAQLHGDESLEFTAKLSFPFFKAFRVSPEFQLEQIQKFGKEYFLLDAFSKQHYGGSGQKLDWDIANVASGLGKLILAGGLTPENVADAVKIVQPWGVDVCSGVESEPGVKDMWRVEKFIRNLRNSFYSNT